MRKLPKYKVCRRLGPGVYEKCQTDKFVLSEARKGKSRKTLKRRRTMSDYNKQLIEKQKVRFSYGVNERQFRRYVKQSSASVGSAESALLRVLESRLDNVVFRFGLAPTRQAARQLVSHGHIFVNGKRVKVASYSVRKGDAIKVREESRDKAVFQLRTEELAKYKQPAWLSLDLKKFEGKVTAAPDYDESKQFFDLGSVIEFYSR